MIDVQDNVLRFFAIDHVLVSVVTTGTTGAIFSLQFTKNRLVARLCPDPLGERECSPDPLAAKNRGPTSKGRGREGREGDRMGGEGKRWEENGRGGEGERAGRGEGPHNANSWIRLCPK